jgi:hypothetical protein
MAKISCTTISTVILITLAIISILFSVICEINEIIDGYGGMALLRIFGNYSFASACIFIFGIIILRSFRFDLCFFSHLFLVMLVNIMIMFVFQSF